MSVYMCVKTNNTHVQPQALHEDQENEFIFTLSSWLQAEVLRPKTNISLSMDIYIYIT